MKKMLFSAALLIAACLCANAQDYKHVSPINLQLIEFNLDTLRAYSVSDDAYINTLTNLQRDLEAEGKLISNAQKSLAGEQKLYKNQMALLKSRKAQIASEQKFFQSEIKQYEAQIKNTKKQYDALKKIEDAQCPAIQEQAYMLDQIQKQCEESKEHCSKVLNKIEKVDVKGLDNAYEKLAEFNIELGDKTTRLNNLSQQNKTNLSIVKAQIKSVKAQLKAASK